MATQLLYMEDFDVIDAEAVVTNVRPADEGDLTIVELDKTCFYPRGGGQDWDTGNMTHGDATFVVEMVRLNEEGVVLHYGKFEGDQFAVGDTAHCNVDGTRRAVNTRLHSAGHLIDMAVNQLGWDSWMPDKGAHYPHMSSVEYKTGDFVADDATQQTLQAKVDELSASNYENKLMFMPASEMDQYCRHIPPNLPANKPSRIVLYADDFGIPCGGTHVRQVNEIGKIEVTKVKSKKGITKVSYSVEGIN